MIDATDRTLLKLLQRNSKLTIKELSNKINLTPTPVFERVKRLEKEGFIEGYKAIINRKKVGLSLLVFCNISLNKHEASFISKFECEIKELRQVVACYHMGGTFDYLVQVVAQDMDEYQHFVSKKLASIENIRQVESAFVMAEIKAMGEIPIT